MFILEHYFAWTQFDVIRKALSSVYRDKAVPRETNTPTGDRIPENRKR